jgi:hypothetical protein
MGEPLTSILLWLGGYFLFGVMLTWTAWRLGMLRGCPCSQALLIPPFWPLAIVVFIAVGLEVLGTKVVPDPPPLPKLRRGPAPENGSDLPIPYDGEA